MRLLDILVARKLAGGGGGSSLIYSDTFAGTIADPFSAMESGITLGEIATAINAFEAVAYVLIDGSAIGASTYGSTLYPTEDGFIASGADENFDGFYVEWDDSGTLVACKAKISGTETDLMPYASLLTTTITVKVYSE